MRANNVKRTYYFGSQLSEGSRDIVNLLGGKGANLAEMTSHRPACSTGVYHHHHYLRGVLPGRRETPKDLTGQY